MKIQDTVQDHLRSLQTELSKGKSSAKAQAAIDELLLLRYNSLPCGTECFTGYHEAPQPTSKKKRHLYLAVASGCRHMICPLCYNFSRLSPPFYSFWEVFTAVFYLYLSSVLLLYVPFMYFIYYCIKHILANFQHFRFCKLSLF